MSRTTAEQMPATVREWTDILARIRFGKVRIAGKTLTGATIKTVAGRLANYADGNGRRVRPGVARLAFDLEVDYHTARRAVSYLRSLGLLGLERAGGRRGADEYRLTLPVDLLDRDDLIVLSPTEQREAIERSQDAHRNLGPTPPRGPNGGGSQIPQGSQNEPGSQIPQGSVKARSAGPITDPAGTAKNAITDPAGTASLIPEGSATYQDLDTTTTHHPDQALRTAVTLSRATGPTTNPDSSLAKSKRCPHGLKATRRGDGRPTCALCRVAEDRPATRQPPPPADDHLAPVIHLPTREAS